MTHLNILLFSALIICSLCAPTNYECVHCRYRIQQREAVPTQSGYDRYSNEILWVLCGLIGLVIFCLIRMFWISRHAYLPCKYYLSAKNATHESVYADLRRKWQAHERVKDLILKKNHLNTATLLDFNKMEELRQLFDEIRLHSKMCGLFFAREQFVLKETGKKTDTLADYFHREVTAIEGLDARIRRLDEILQNRY